MRLRQTRLPRRLRRLRLAAPLLRSGGGRRRARGCRRGTRCSRRLGRAGSGHARAGRRRARRRGGGGGGRARAVRVLRWQVTVALPLAQRKQALLRSAGRHTAPAWMHRMLLSLLRHDVLHRFFRAWATRPARPVVQGICCLAACSC